MRRAARTALLPAVLTVLAVAVQFFPGVVANRRRTIEWLPGFGSPAATAAVSTALGAVGMALVLAGACALGYREARHRDVGRTYLRYVGVVAAAGATTMLLIFAGTVVAGGTMRSNPFMELLTVTALLVGVPGVLTVAALAGVALATAREEGAPARSTRPLLSVGLGAAALVGAGYVLDSVGTIAIVAGDGVGVPASLPQFGSIGTTVVTYLQAGRLASDLVLLGGGVALGALTARRYGVTTASRRVLGTAVAGALGGLLVAWPVVTWYVTIGGAGTSGLSFATIGASIPDALVSTALVAALSVVAGVGVGRFEADDGDSDGSRTTGGRGFDSATETP
ncbi:hypothetical protein [Halosimplex sp. J119]